MTLTCPVCETVNEETRCRQCSTDLGPLARVTQLPQQYCQQGERLLEKGDVEGALERLSAAASLEPTSAEIHLALARAYSTKSLHDEALAHCDAALRLSPQRKQLAEETRQSVVEQREVAVASQRLQTRRLGRLVWMLPAIAFALGLASAAVIQMRRGVAPPPPLAARVRAGLAAHSATRGLSLSVAEQAGVVHVSGVVPSDLYLGLVREFASESADGHVDFGGLAVAPSEPPTIYRVRQGDSLWLIAKRKYGNAALWPEIEKVNRGRSIPLQMLVGDRLILPAVTIHPR